MGKKRRSVPAIYSFDRIPLNPATGKVLNVKDLIEVEGRLEFPPGLTFINRPTIGGKPIPELRSGWRDRLATNCRVRLKIDLSPTEVDEIGAIAMNYVVGRTIEVRGVTVLAQARRQKRIAGTARKLLALLKPGEREGDFEEATWAHLENGEAGYSRRDVVYPVISQLAHRAAEEIAERPRTHPWEAFILLLADFFERVGKRKAGASKRGDAQSPFVGMVAIVLEDIVPSDLGEHMKAHALVKSVSDILKIRTNERRDLRRPREINDKK